MTSQRATASDAEQEAIARRIVEWVAERQGGTGLVNALCDPDACIAANNARRFAIWFGKAKKASGDRIADYVRIHAAIQLREVKDDEAIIALAAVLAHARSVVREHATETAVHLKDPRLLPALVARLEDTHANVRRNAEAAIVATNSSRKVPVLLSALQQCGAPGRLKVIDLLDSAMSVGRESRSDDPVVRTALAARLQDADWKVRCRAAALLKAMQWKPSSIEERVHAALVMSDWNTLAMLGNAAAALDRAMVRKPRQGDRQGHRERVEGNGTRCCRLPAAVGVPGLQP